MSARCSRALLAASPAARVERCTCGHLHVSIGPVTVRVDEDSLRALADTLERATRSLDDDEGALRRALAALSGREPGPTA